MTYHLILPGHPIVVKYTHILYFCNSVWCTVGLYQTISIHLAWTQN